MGDILDQIKREMGYSNLDDAELLEMAEYFDSLSDADLDDLDDAEYAEYLDYIDAVENAEHKLRRRSHGHRPHRSAHRPHGHSGHKRPLKKPSNILRGRRKLDAVGGGGRYAKPGTTAGKSPVFASPAYIQELMTRSKGDLNITVTRNSNNLAFALPYILFGLNGFNSNYISTIKQYLPAGVTMTASVVAATGDVLLTYTDGIGTDTVTLSLTGSLISYSEFLQNMNSNFFKSMYIRQEYPNDANLLSAKSQPINFGLLSALGMKNANTLLPRSRSLNSDFKDYIINLFISEQKITSDFSFVQNIIQTNAAYSIGWDVFMSDRTNLNNI